MEILLTVILASYVSMKLLAEDFNDPFHILWSIRTVIGKTFLRGILECEYCLSFWVSQVVTHAFLLEFNLASAIYGLSAYGALFVMIRIEELANFAIYPVEEDDEEDDEPIIYAEIPVGDTIE